MSVNYARFLHSPQKHNSAPSCADCGFLDDCGGLEGADFLRGCFSRCQTHCIQKGCDLACPSLPFLFSELIEDVGGICVPPEANLNTTTFDTFSPYIAQIDHGSRRDRLLDEALVAIPLHAIFSKRRGKTYGIRYDSAESIRRAFKLTSKTEIIITCISPDQYLEDFWFAHVKRDLLSQLKLLRIRAITIPNFSFMKDVPRTNALYNFGRMFRVAERASAAGLAVILHLQASNERDWLRWCNVLKEQPRANCVALEFQTGASRKGIGDLYYESLCELQQRLGRNLHPVILAGAGRLRQLKTNFQSYTVIDSTPFMKTVSRQYLFESRGNKFKWHTVPTAPEESLSDRLKQNISTHRARLLSIVKSTNTET